MKLGPKRKLILIRYQLIHLLIRFFCVGTFLFDVKARLKFVARKIGVVLKCLSL